MNAKENAHPIVAATERAAGTAACSRATISYQHYSTAECDRQPKIADLLCRGQENAVPLRNLESLTGLDGRTIRAMIATERRAGIAALSDNATGYYLPANEEEKARCERNFTGGGCRGKDLNEWRTGRRKSVRRGGRCYITRGRLFRQCRTLTPD